MIDLGAPGAVRWICRTLEEAGHETWAVGGAVRDRLAGRPSGDWDLTTRARPEQVRRIFRRTVPIGLEHGTVGVLSRDGTLYEVTTFRQDVETTGRHAVVAFADTLDEDLARRDFTINAVAWHPLQKAVHDPWGGREDLEKGLLRTVGPAAERFAEDYLRVLRALRFAGTFRLRIDTATWRALVAAVPRTGALSPERIREELEKILALEPPSRPSSGLALWAASGALGFLLPELDALVGRSAEGRPGDAWSHGLRTVDLLPAGRPELRWIALLGRTGTPDEPTGAGEGGEPPSRRGLLRAAAVLKRLRSSNARIDRVAGGVEWVADPPAPGGDDEALRRWLAAVGRARVPDLLRVWAAEVRSDEARGGGGGWSRPEFCTLARRVRALARAPVALTVDELDFSGRDLIAMGHRPGPHFGELLRHLLDRVLADPALNRQEALADEAARWMAAQDESLGEKGRGDQGGGEQGKGDR